MVLIRAKEQLEVEAASGKIPPGEAEDASDDLAKLTSELEKPEKDPGRIAKLWQRIKDVTPTVAGILASAASIAKVIESTHGH